MKKVDIIMNESLKSIIGPSQTVKRIIRSKEFFLENGFDIKVYTADDVEHSSIYKAKKNKNVLIKRVLEKTRWLALHSKIYGRIRINHMLNESHKLLEHYMKNYNKPDVIVFHSMFDCYDYLKNYQKEGAQEKICVFTHSDGFVYDMLLSYFPKLRGTSTEKKLADLSDYVMSKLDVKPCIARIEETNLLKQYPQLKGKTCLVINGIDDLSEEEIFEIKEIRARAYEKKYRFVCVGSINGRKGQGLIVEALHETDRKFLNEVSVTFVGAGPEKISLEDKVNEYGLQDIVKFVGAVPNTEVYKYLAQGNIGILMSSMEGLPIGLLECLRGGLAIVSTNVSGIPELINEGKNGVLINCDKEELKILLTKLDTFNWEEMGKESREYFLQAYKFDRMKNDYLSMLKMAVV